MMKTENTMKYKRQGEGCDKNKSLTKMLVYYMDGGKRTYYSWIFYDKKSKESGMEKLKKYAKSLESSIFSAIIYDNISGEELLRVVVPTRSKIDNYAKNKKS